MKNKERLLKEQNWKIKYQKMNVKKNLEQRKKEIKKKNG